ncbi:hypothetical protein E2562_009930 [Oryza meyeriana var. granulata]|uniref:Uncharacterized protein n=1 Tax=Oryza meyeriana var. granulata TaxID=110450 RepID=A0A6G1BT68_9ORYZ|nr:hypothetical protein E2562_009930 [Oryza meyeriana var. granulata]
METSLVTDFNSISNGHTRESSFNPKDTTKKKGNYLGWKNVTVVRHKRSERHGGGADCSPGGRGALALGSDCGVSSRLSSGRARTQSTGSARFGGGAAHGGGLNGGSTNGALVEGVQGHRAPVRSWLCEIAWCRRGSRCGDGDGDRGGRETAGGSRPVTTLSLIHMRWRPRRTGNRGRQPPCYDECRQRPARMEGQAARRDEGSGGLGPATMIGEDGEQAPREAKAARRGTCPPLARRIWRRLRGRRKEIGGVSRVVTEGESGAR